MSLKVTLFSTSLGFIILFLSASVEAAPEKVNQSAKSNTALHGNQADDSEGLAQRDPFRLPQYLINRIKEKSIVARTDSATVDDSIDPVRRWPVGTYQLVGIISDVKRPKAMFLDKQNSIHMLQVNDRIGNGGGVLREIGSGEVTVVENKTPIRLKLTK